MQLQARLLEGEALKTRVEGKAASQRKISDGLQGA
jgi:hypothetical protein